MPRLYIGSVPRNADEKDIKRFFRDYGRVRSVDLKNGFGFVEMDDRRDANDAIKDLDGEKLLGERVTVEMARASVRLGDEVRHGHSDSRNYGDYSYNSRRPIRSDHRVIVQNLSTRVSWQDLKDLMRKVGEVTFADAHKIRESEGVVEFSNRSDMKAAIYKYDGYTVYGLKLKVYADRKSGSYRRSTSRSRGRKRRRRYSSRSRRSLSRSESRSDRSFRYKRSRSRKRYKSSRHSTSTKRSRSRSEQKLKSANRSKSCSRSKNVLLKADSSTENVAKSKSHSLCVSEHQQYNNVSKEDSKSSIQPIKDNNLSKSNRSRSKSRSKSISRSRSKTRSKSISRSPSRSRSKSISRLRSISRSNSSNSSKIKKRQKENIMRKS